MGALVYDDDRAAEFDDRTLAHLQVIIVNKLRRLESFPFTWSDDRRAMTVWISPATPIAFVFHGNRRPTLNRAWLEELALVVPGEREALEASELVHDDDLQVGERAVVELRRVVVVVHQRAHGHSVPRAGEGWCAGGALRAGPDHPLRRHGIAGGS